MLEMILPVTCEVCGNDPAEIVFTAAQTPEDAVRLMARLLTEMLPDAINKMVRHVQACHPANPVLAPKSEILCCTHCDVLIGIPTATNHAELAEDFATHVTRYHAASAYWDYVANNPAIRN